MTPKDKAKQLVEQFNCGGLETFAGHNVKVISKQCALIAVDVILIDCGAKDWAGDEACEGKNFWQEVKTEIENL